MSRVWYVCPKRSQSDHAMVMSPEYLIGQRAPPPPSILIVSLHTIMQSCMSIQAPPAWIGMASGCNAHALQIISSVDPMHLPGSGCNASADAHALQIPSWDLQCGPNAPPREWMQCLSRCSCTADPVLGPPVWTQCTSQGVDAMPQPMLMPCRSRPGTSSVDPMHLPGSGCNASADAHALQIPSWDLQCGPNAPPREWMQCLSRCSCTADPVLGPPVWTQCTSQGVDAMPQPMLMYCRSHPGTSSVDPGCNASADAHALQMIHADPICMHRHLAQRGYAPREWNAVPQLMSSQAPICMHR